MHKVGIWHVNGKATNRLKSSSVNLEKYFEDWIEKDPSLVQAGLEIVGRQITLKAGKLDLLAIDPQGRWVIIEIKRDILRREIIGQVLDYASSLDSLSEEELRNKIDNYLEPRNKKLDDLLEARGAADSLQPENREFLFTLVGTGKRQGLERISDFLAQQYDFPISIITFQVFETTDGSKFLTREILESESIEIPAEKEKYTGENVRALAKSNGFQAEFDKFLKIKEELGFYPRYYKNSVMFTPPTNKTRMLFTVWGQSSNGRMRTYKSPSAFAEFYPITVEDASRFIGADGWHFMDSKEIDEFITQLKEMFNFINENTAD